MDFSYISRSNVLIECPCCMTEFYVNIEADLEEESSDERKMGTETQYGFTQEVVCPECKNSSIVTGEIWEYPSGVENDFQITNVDSECNIDVKIED